MRTKLIKLKDEILIEVEAPKDQAQQISGGITDTVNTTIENIKPILLNVCRPVVDVWNEINTELEIEQAEIELGLSFEGEGNIFIAKTKTGANLGIKILLKPKKN